MNDSETSEASPKPRGRQKPSFLVWALLVGLLVVVAWQQLQIGRLSEAEVMQRSGAITETDESVLESSASQPATSAAEIDPSLLSGAGPDTVDNARRLMDRRAREIRQLSPEATGQRMFEELKFVAGDDQATLTRLTQQLIIEGRQRRSLEQQAASGAIDQDALAIALQTLVEESESFAKEVLTPAQFDRYREVRQSWRRGRAHPHFNKED